jgi:uncharacterized SAM-binding protein YcdF (DUF218 family)
VLRRVASLAAAAIVVVLLAVGVSGYFLFTRAQDDEIRQADAIVVLGGEHDGRERYGLDLAQQVGARTVLLSNSYAASDSVMASLCNSTVQGLRVLCRIPVPPTTRGEALMARQAAREYGWRQIAVVTWRFHLPRARKIFAQCYSGEPGRVLMRAVPRSYELPMGVWEFLYIYQYAGLVKTVIQGPCD